MLTPERLTVKAGQALQAAQAEARTRDSASVDGLHLLSALIEQEGGIVLPILSKLEVNASLLRSRLADALDSLPKVRGGSDPTLSRDLRRALNRALAVSAELEDEYVSTEHLLLALAEGKGDAARILQGLGAKPRELRTALEAVRGSHRVLDDTPEDSFRALERYSRDLTRIARSGKLDPVIGRDTEIRRVIRVLARRTKNNPILIGEPGVGKTAIAEGLAQRMVAGDVPTTLANKKLLQLDIAAMLAGAKYRGEFEERLKTVLKEITEAEGRYVVFIDETHTIVGAGASQGAVDAGNMFKPALARGELRMLGATTLDEYRNHIEKDPALERRFQPVFVAPSSVEDAIAILRGLKERYQIHHGVRIRDEAVVAAARLSDRYVGGRFLPDKAIDLLDEAASRLRIEIDSLPHEIDVIERRITQLEIERQALKGEEGKESKERSGAIETELSELRELSQSRKAAWQAEKNLIERIRELRARTDDLRLEAERATRTGELNRVAEIRYGEIPAAEGEIESLTVRLDELQSVESFLREEVSADDIAAVVAEWTGIPVTRLVSSERDRLVDLEVHLGSRVIGQPAALAAVSNAVRRARAGIQNPDRPVGSFIFLGPTGVGKTETARALADFIFDDERAMVRIDMSEYMEKHAVSRLIGAPPGYVGFEDGGQLTEAVRRRPHAVILFDEIEKAHPEIFNVLLQLLDDGRLTDAKGRAVDFRNAVVIMTSNIGGDRILQAGERGTVETEWEAIERDVRSGLRSRFRPEFLNRVDEIVVFRPLGVEALAEIVEIQLARVAELARSAGIELETTPEARRRLAVRGFDPAFGARPLRREIQRSVQDPLALLMLESELPENARVVVETEGDALRLRVSGEKE